jgi:hemerythrin-like domain-containing protein
MTDLDLWSADPLAEGSRPHVTPGRPARPIGEGRTLILVHRHLRQELAQIRSAIEEVADGRLTPEQARDHINQTTMRQNYWTLGSFCASYCRVLTMHHTLEDQMFPSLAHRRPELGPVVAKLSQEHEVIADVLTAIDSTLTAMMSDESRLDDVREHVRLLDRLLTSHLDYEEDQLVAPLSDFLG